MRSLVERPLTFRLSSLVCRSHIRRRHFNGAALRFVIVLQDEEDAARLESVDIVNAMSYFPLIFLLKDQNGYFQPVYKTSLARNVVPLLIEKEESLEDFRSQDLKVTSA